MHRARLVHEVRHDLGVAHRVVRVGHPRAVVRRAVVDDAERRWHARVLAGRVERRVHSAPLGARAVLGLHLAAEAARGRWLLGQRGVHRGGRAFARQHRKVAAHAADVAAEARRRQDLGEAAAEAADADPVAKEAHHPPEDGDLDERHVAAAHRARVLLKAVLHVAPVLGHLRRRVARLGVALVLLVHTLVRRSRRRLGGRRRGSPALLGIAQRLDDTRRPHIGWQQRRVLNLALLDLERLGGGLQGHRRAQRGRGALGAAHVPAPHVARDLEHAR